MSASERLSRQLSLGRARQLEQLSCSVVPKIFEGLVSQDRRILLEVACDNNSLLTATVQSVAGHATAASRCLLEDKCDLSTPEGVELVINRIKLERPRHVWISPPGSAYSPFQSLNQRNPEQQQELREQRKQALRIYQGAAVIVYTCQQLGVHCTWEWSEGCNGWRLPLVQRLIQRGGLQTVVVKGCRVNLRDPSSGQLARSGWKIATTCARLAEVLNMPCRCNSTYQHGRLSGKHTGMLRRYTPEMCRRVASVMAQEMNQHSVAEELRGTSNLGEGFGDGLCCRCEEVSTPENKVRCQACVQGDPTRRTAQATRPQVNQVGVQGLTQHGDEASGTKGRVGEDDVSLEEFEAFMSTEEIQDVEAQAQQLNQTQNFQQDKCTELLRRLPFKPIRKHRGMLGDSRTVYVLLGTYAFGNHYGLTSHTRTFPQLSKYLNKFMENWSGGPFCRSSLVISWNNLLPLHRDVNNDSRYLNHMIGLGDYQHGELWLQSSESAEAGRDQRRQLPNGEWIRGRLWDVKGKVVKFAPNKWHQTQKWSGERITLTAFVSRGVHHLNESERARAKSCGFVLPPPEPTRVSTNKEEALAAESQQKAEEERIMKQLYLLHSATGHGSVKTMIDALKRRGASQRVLDLASRFVCSACQERKRPPPRRLASLEVLPPRWQTITADVGHWTHPQSGETVQFMLVIDEGSRFRIAKVLSRGSRQQPSAATCLAYLREAWFQVFGRPDVLRLDPAGSFRGQQAEDFCDRHSVYLDVIAADAHWQIGVCENAIKGVKHVMERVCACDEQLTAEEALALAIEVFNSREQVRGFTPIQHAFGRNPDVTGRLISRPEQIPEEALVENAHEDFARQAQMRADAEKALCDWQARQRISRAMHSRSRPQISYRPGGEWQEPPGPRDQPWQVLRTGQNPCHGRATRGRWEPPDG